MHKTLVFVATAAIIIVVIVVSIRSLTGQAYAPAAKSGGYGSSLVQPKQQ